MTIGDLVILGLSKRDRRSASQASNGTEIDLLPRLAVAGTTQTYSQAEQNLIAVCVALISELGNLSEAERKLINSLAHKEIPSSWEIKMLRTAILQGFDPLGKIFTSIRLSADRRAAGAIYTPHPIVHSMMTWLFNQDKPTRIVDPGAGSGRFILTAGGTFPDAELVAIETDPLAALTLRASLNVRGWTKRATILVQDYREIKLPRHSGVTAFVGNPPYVRHHDISGAWKSWYAQQFDKLDIKASALAGLHLHFFLQTRLLSKSGDIGTFITSSEWMDVNYGSALRELLLKELGGISLHVLESKVEAFPGTATTAAITCFRVGETKAPLCIRSVRSLSRLNGLSKGINVSRERLKGEPRWSIIIRPPSINADATLELGEFFRVHRGQVTGANDIWIANEYAKNLPDHVKIPSVTKAKDLIQAGASLQSLKVLRQVIDLPPELDRLPKEERRSIDIFLSWAKGRGADKGYVAQHRKMWWSVGLRAPAPILCTYMARRAPQFTLNICHARHINIAHGLYPRERFAPSILQRLVAWLNQNIGTESGRTYSGGLTKFEPKEIERLRIPHPESLVL